ncbi:MAG: UPF0280 family protein [Pseudomonadota bacterium]
MSTGAQSAFLPDGRLHLHHGPIDLIISAEGPDASEAFESAERRFSTVLTDLMQHLPDLTRAFEGQSPNDPIAERMVSAVAPLAPDQFVTPMAAVAGAVADEICAVLAKAPITKAVVNNGGDVAFCLTEGEVFRAASSHGTLALSSDGPVRGLATSGWRGRSQSFGIADAVTVLAESAARADAAATLIANAVDLPGHPAVTRQPAEDIEAIPQLGSRLVTVDVGPLTAEETDAALAAGTAYADTLLKRGVICAALLLLNDQTRIIGSADIATALPADPS